MSSLPQIHPSVLPRLSAEYIAFHASLPPGPPPLEDASDWSAGLRDRRGGVQMGREPVDGVGRWEGTVEWDEDEREEDEGEWAVGLGTGRCDVGVFCPEELPADGAKLPIFVYIAGGGFVFPPPPTSSFLTRTALLTPCVLVMPRPRTAPEGPWPAAVEGSWNVVRWLLGGRAAKEWDALGVDVPASRIDWGKVALGGASAGGNVAAILAQKLTRPAYAGLTPLTQLLLFNAVLDGTASVSNPAYPSWQDNQHCPDLSAKTMRAFWSLYRRPDSSPPPWSHPLLSPALAPAAVLARLPKVWICEGSVDLVRDEGLVFARRIREAKALADDDPAVEVRLYDGVAHGYTIQDGVLAVGRTFVDDVQRALQGGF